MENLGQSHETHQEEPTGVLEQMDHDPRLQHFLQQFSSVPLVSPKDSTDPFTSINESFDGEQFQEVVMYTLADGSNASIEKEPIASDQDDASSGVLFRLQIKNGQEIRGALFGLRQQEDGTYEVYTVTPGANEVTEDEQSLARAYIEEQQMLLGALEEMPEGHDDELFSLIKDNLKQNIQKEQEYLSNVS